MKMDSTTLSIIACVIAIGVVIGMIVMYKKRLIDKELIEGAASLLQEIEIPTESVFGMILEYAKTAVLTVEQLVKTGVINKDDESRKKAAMGIVETAAKVDGLEYTKDEEEVASACIEAEVAKLPRNNAE